MTDFLTWVAAVGGLLAAVFAGLAWLQIRSRDHFRLSPLRSGVVSLTRNRFGLAIIDEVSIPHWLGLGDTTDAAFTSGWKLRMNDSVVLRVPDEIPHGEVVRVAWHTRRRPKKTRWWTGVLLAA